MTNNQQAAREWLPTSKQVELLRLVQLDGVLELSGESARRVNTRTLNSCIDKGWLSRSIPFQAFAGAYQPRGVVLTEAGKNAIRHNINTPEIDGGQDH